MQSTVSDIRTKWSKLSADLSTRRAQFERCLSKWREYEREYEKINGWLSQKEAECSELVAIREDVSARQECLEKSQVRGVGTGLCVCCVVCVVHMCVLERERERMCACVRVSENVCV